MRKDEPAELVDVAGAGRVAARRRTVAGRGERREAEGGDVFKGSRPVPCVTP